MLTTARFAMNPPALDIAQLGHPVLRTTAQPMDAVPDPQLQTWIEALLGKMAEGNGVGIAAPQVGISKQLLIVASHPTPRYPNAPHMDPVPMLNPRIVEYSGSVELGWEGCLSVPGLRGLVPRYPEVTVAYLDPAGNAQRQTFHGFVARILQHEYDHLQGLLFIDRVESTQALMSEAEYQRQILGSVIN